MTPAPKRIWRRSSSVRKQSPRPHSNWPAKMPRPGESVYVFGRVRGQAEPKLYTAAVGQVAKTHLIYAFNRQEHRPARHKRRAGAGREGQVVGMHVGGGEQSGQLIGIANPTTAIRAAIASAPRK
jgi:hypothetical protein